MLNQQTQSTYDAEPGNRTWDRLVEGESSHHCTNPAPLRFKQVVYAPPKNLTTIF